MCKKKSGDAMSCTSCHDPHYEPPAEERVSYYREKCLACHGTHFAAKHHPNQPDCTLCHMPAAASTDVAHTQVTDHRIPRRPGRSRPSIVEDASPSASTPRLVPFPDSADAEHDLRDLALAWQSLANDGVEAAEPHAESLLRSAVAEFPNDPDLLSALAYVEQRHGLTAQASELYRRALAVNPDLIDAATDLGVIEAESGHLREAAELWQGAFQRAPGRSSSGHEPGDRILRRSGNSTKRAPPRCECWSSIPTWPPQKGLAEPESHSSGMFGMSVHGHEHIDSAALSSTKNVLIPGVNCFFFSGSFR